MALASPLFMGREGDGGFSAGAVGMAGGGVCRGRGGVRVCAGRRVLGHRG